MNTLYFDADHSDAERRKNLYEGQLFVLIRARARSRWSSTPAT